MPYVLVEDFKAGIDTRRTSVTSVPGSLYGLNDASLQFYIKVRSVLLELGCTQSTMDPALFYMRDKAGKLMGVVAIHADNIINVFGFW